MNRKVFTGLVIMMVLSVTGITWVQVVWLRNAINVRNENFNNAVFVSLTNAVEEIESDQRLDSYNNFLWGGPAESMDTVPGLTEYFSFGSYVSSGNGTLSIDIESRYATIDSAGNSRRVIIVKDTSIVDSLRLSFSSVDGGQVRVDEGDAGAGMNDSRVFVREKEFLEWVRKRSEQFRNMSDRMLYEIYEAERLKEPDTRQITSTLSRIFPFYGIRTPFEVAVIRDGEIASASSKKIGRNDFLRSIYKARLFPENLIQKNMVLSVVFPERTNYVLGSMAWMLGGSLLFSLFIFSTFALSLYFILRQKKISEIKSDFINNMTHEFKTPIATISLAADTITNPRVIKDEESVRHFISMIKKENSRMNKQVETILQIASLDKKEIEFRFDKASIHEVIERAIETIDIQVQQKQGVLTKMLDASDDTVQGDVEHLTNLVHNLLDNAIKYSPEKPEIRISTVNREGGVVVTVEDKGIGMSRSVQSKIFERFYRQASGNVHDVKGFGLGLNYVKAIVDAHRGTIHVTSEPGKGSRFDVFLPSSNNNLK